MWNCDKETDVFLVNEYFNILADDFLYLVFSIQFFRDQLNLTPLMVNEFRLTGLGGEVI